MIFIQFLGVGDKGRVFRDRPTAKRFLFFMCRVRMEIFKCHTTPLVLNKVFYSSLLIFWDVLVPGLTLPSWIHGLLKPLFFLIYSKPDILM